MRWVLACLLLVSGAEWGFVNTKIQQKNSSSNHSCKYPDDFLEYVNQRHACACKTHHPFQLHCIALHCRYVFVLNARYPIYPTFPFPLPH